MEINLTAKQTQKFTATMIQAAEILQMGTQELETWVQTVLQENPVVEAAPASHDEDFEQPEREDTSLQGRVEWQYAHDWQNRHYHRSDREAVPEPIECGWRDWNKESIHEHLLSQIPPHRHPAVIEAAMRTIIVHIDSCGYFAEDFEEFASHQKHTPKTMLRALSLVQQMEPAGVGARDIAECLCLQLERMGMNGLPLTIARQHLEDMGRNRYGVITQKTGVTRQAVQAACTLIRSLNPKPGAAFFSSETPEYAIPDLVVVCEKNTPSVFPLNHRLPKLHMSPYYQALAQETSDAQVKAYLQEKLRQAQWVMQGIEQRSSTLLACAESIVEKQKDFFIRGSKYLQPLALADVAQEVQFHESTVSRAIKDKWLQCDSGVFPLSHFFSRSLGQDDNAVSTDRVKGLLRELIAQEDKRNPLSDEKLAEQLKQRNVPISRRTIAKYRDQHNIPSAAGRREYE